MRSIDAIGVIGTSLIITTITTFTTTRVVIGVPQLRAIPVVVLRGLLRII